MKVEGKPFLKADKLEFLEEWKQENQELLQSAGLVDECDSIFLS
jgi:hypothetical protein